MRDHRGRLVLGLLCSVQFVLVLDVTIVAVALPSLRDGLGFSAGGLQWVISAYVLAFAGFLLELSGPPEELDRAEAWLAERGVTVERIKT